jgi:hypothetical protein
VLPSSRASSIAFRNVRRVQKRKMHTDMARIVLRVRIQFRRRCFRR